MKKTVVSILILAAVFYAETNLAVFPKHQRLDDLKWLAGAWVSDYEGGKLFEIWKVEQDGSLKGESFLVKNGDTTFIESITIESRKDSILYIVKLKLNKTVVFNLIELKGYHAKFENLLNPYPRRISYTRNNEKNLHARIEGTMNGEPRSEDFYMIKVN